VLVLVVWINQFQQPKYAQLYQNKQLEAPPNFSDLLSTPYAGKIRENPLA